MPDADLFDESTDARGDDVPVSRRRAWVQEKPCELMGKGPKPKKADLNPQQRAWFERHGYTFVRVDHPNPYGGNTIDLMGVADYMAFRPGEIALVQMTTHSEASKRQRKCEESKPAKGKPKSHRDYLRAWLAADGAFYIHGWHQPGGKGTRWELVSRKLVRMGEHDAEWEIEQP